MKKFKVNLCRTYYAFSDIEVEAETEKKAKEIALECAENFSIKDFDTEVYSCYEEK